MKIEYECRDDQNKLITIKASDEDLPCPANIFIDATIGSWDYPDDTVNIDCENQGGIILKKDGLSHLIKILTEIENQMS